MTEDPGEAVVTAAANPALSAEKAEANAAGKEPAGVVAAEASRTTPTPVGTAPGATSRGPQKGPQKGPKKGPQKAKSGRKKR